LVVNQEMRIPVPPTTTPVGALPPLFFLQGTSINPVADSLAQPAIAPSYL